MSALARSLSFALVLLSACAVPDGGSPAKDDSASAAQQKQRDLVEAKLALDVTTRKQAAAVADAEGELVDAKRELTQAEQAVQDLARQAAHELDEAKIGRDEASHRADEAKAELAELQAMYQADEFATMTKELVLQRGQRALEIAERRLRAQDQKLVLLEQVEQAHKRRELVGKVEAARLAAAKSMRALQQAQADAELELLKAKHAIAKAEAEASEGKDHK